MLTISCVFQPNVQCRKAHTSVDKLMIDQTVFQGKIVYATDTVFVALVV